MAASRACTTNMCPATNPPTPLKGKRVAVLLYSCYPSDPRPRRAAEAMIQEGMLVELICLSESKEEPARSVENGVAVTRIPLRRTRRGKIAYIVQYSLFISISFLLLSFRALRRRFDLVHVHNMPDVLVFSAAVAKLLGAKVVLDLHDPMPELMMSIYQLREESLSVRILKLLERWSIRSADLVLTPNVAFRELFISRSCPPSKIEIVMNSPQTEIFDPAKYPSKRDSASGGTKPFVVMFHGFIAERQGLHIAVDAVALLRDRIPSLQFHIFGKNNPFMEKISERIRDLHLESVIRFHGFQPHNVIAEALANSDVVLIPNLRNPFTELNMPTRIFETLAMGKTVIAPNTRGVRDYFDNTQLSFFEPGNVADLSRAILEAYENPSVCRERLDRAMAVYHRHLWPQERATFIGAVSRLELQP